MEIFGIKRVVEIFNEEETSQGTSQAAPHVSACIAKLCLDNDFYTTSIPSYTASKIEEILFSSALDLDNNGKDIYFGHGALRYTNINEKTEINQCQERKRQNEKGKIRSYGYDVFSLFFPCGKECWQT